MIRFRMRIVLIVAALSLTVGMVVTARSVTAQQAQQPTAKTIGMNIYVEEARVGQSCVVVVYRNGLGVAAVPCR